MRVLLALAIIVMMVAAAYGARTNKKFVLDDELINRINSRQNSWKAGRNPRFEGVTIDEAKAMLGLVPKWNGVRRFAAEERKSSIPTEFDSREKWGSCIGPIRNQQQCGSCWAFSASEVLADRFCIATGQPFTKLSPEYILECDTTDDGCNGGQLNTVWDFLTEVGTTTDACNPYVSGNGTVPTTGCPSTCVDGSEPQMYQSTGGYQLYSVEDIQREIMNNGPVQAAFSVYQDFFSYTSGVYVQQSGSLVGGHAIKIVGWGVDHNTNQPYWIVANSWGTDWGLNGYFWILRGQDECGIEDDVWAGMPATN